jgi:hypothetical protein
VPQTKTGTEGVSIPLLHRWFMQIKKYGGGGN